MLTWVSTILIGLTALTAISIPFAARNIRGALALAACWIAVVVLVTLGGGVLTGYPRQATSINGLAYPFESAQLEVIAFEMVPDVAIYVWARNPDRVPINLALDWSDEMASGLYKGQQESKQSGGQLMLDLGVEVNGDDGLGQREHNEGVAGGGGGGGGGGAAGGNYGPSAGPVVYVGQRDFPLKEESIAAE